MESIIYDDSPLAHYLEGEGEGEGVNDLISIANKSGTTSPVDTAVSFAPRGHPKPVSRARGRPPPLQVVSSSRSIDASVISSRIGSAEKTHFLEQFRYIIVASQLLSEYPNPTSYQRRELPSPAENGVPQPEAVRLSILGICVTAATAFTSAWAINWARRVGLHGLSFWRIFSVCVLLILGGTGLYLYMRRQWIKYLRSQAVQHASALIDSAQAFDCAASSAITLIQEVELVSRGYKINAPLSPATRMEDQSRTRRCGRLRRVVQRSLSVLPSSYYQAFETVRPLTSEDDLEKYYDIYEIRRSDIQDAGESTSTSTGDADTAETLAALKIGMQKLHLNRKLLLCSLLALDADGSNSNFPIWSIASDSMQRLAHEAYQRAMAIDQILQEEETFPEPPTPKIKLTPSRERVRRQMRNLSCLSHGIRDLQAKMHLLRDESDRVLDESNDVSDISANLLMQYDSIGEGLRTLMQEWHEGREALSTSIGKNETRLSLSPGQTIAPMSPTSSLGGLTAVEGNSPDALKPSNGNLRMARSRSSTANSSSGEEVFEAVALPRRRSCVTREERIAKMKEDRTRQSIAKEKAESQTYLLKELETVIKLRPRGRSTGRMTGV
ncbi:MAG: hypothetical protein Q9191_004497 [Dirinaria sp. TL-2023a]